MAFGLPTVSLVGPFSFLFFIGLNNSAISIAEDSSLRRKIKDSARQQLKMFGSIGTAEMESRLEKTVLEITKSNAESFTHQTGIEPSLSVDEVKQYLNEVLVELKSPRGERIIKNRPSYGTINIIVYVTNYSNNNSGSVGTMWNFTLVQLLSLIMIL